jgi:hypothetical protein
VCMRAPAAAAAAAAAGRASTLGWLRGSRSASGLTIW